MQSDSQSCSVTESTISKLESDPKGSAIIEFAIVLPLVTGLIFGIVQYGLIFTTHTTIKDIASIAARYSTLSSAPSDTDVENYVRSLVIAASLDVTRLNPAPSVQPATVGGFNDARSVEIFYQHPVYFRVPGTDNNGQYVIRVRTIAR